MGVVTPAATHDVTVNANIITFIVSDPLSVGFAAIRVAHPGSDDFLTAAANSKTGPGSGLLPAGQIDSGTFDDLVDDVEFGSLTAAQLSSLAHLTRTGSFNVGSAHAQNKIAAAVPQSPKTVTALSGAASRPASPWELYFGSGLVATNAILDAARNSGAGNNF